MGVFHLLPVAIDSLAPPVILSILRGAASVLPAWSFWGASTRCYTVLHMVWAEVAMAAIHLSDVKYMAA
eukprot:1161075-Pelagomonas_calceolata.AAC.9